MVMIAAQNIVAQASSLCKFREKAQPRMAMLLYGYAAYKYIVFDSSGFYVIKFYCKVMRLRLYNFFYVR